MKRLLTASLLCLFLFLAQVTIKADEVHPHWQMVCYDYGYVEDCWTYAGGDTHCEIVRYIDCRMELRYDDVDYIQMSAPEHPNGCPYC